MKTTPRETSIKAYHEIDEEGLLTKNIFKAYVALYANGPCTSRELDGFLGVLTSGRKRAQQPRVKSLVDQGVAKETGRTVCSITGRKVLYYDVTAELPKTPRHIPTIKEVEIFLHALIRYEHLFAQEDMVQMWPVLNELFFKLEDARRKKGLQDIENRRPPPQGSKPPNGR